MAKVSSHRAAHNGRSNSNAAIGAGQKRPGFSIRVDRFGPIVAGNLAIAPLVVLVGKNSTGKSYLATLLWSFLSNEGIIPHFSDPGSDPPAWFIEKFEQPIQERQEQILDVSAEMVERWINECIAGGLERELLKIFSSPAISAAKIEISLLPQAPIRVIHVPMSGVQFGLASYSFDGDERTFRFSLNPDKDEAKMLRRVIISNLARIFMGVYNEHLGSQCLYIPAARTGLMLALGSLVDASLGGLAAAQQPRPQTTLPLPTVRFLQAIIRRRKELGHFGPTADFLEETVLQGKVHVERNPDASVPAYFFERDNSGRLPLYVTSSMVTELIPIVEAMRQDENYCFILEEPEAHLHLTAQRQMARAIVRLVNAGATVVVTTHSDTFLQQINLSLTLGDKRKSLDSVRRKYGYEPIDTLTQGQVRCYEFVEESMGTVIREAEATEDGFIVKSINDPLFELAGEVRDVQITEDETN